MKQLLVTFVFLFLFGSIIHAQVFCGTPAITNVDNAKKLTTTQKRSASSEYNLTVYFHVIRDSTGLGGVSISNVNSAYDKLNEDFNNHGIYFIWDGNIDYINKNVYYHNNPDTCMSIFLENNHINGIDIYLFPSNPNYTYFSYGHSYGVGMNSEFLIVGNVSDTPACMTSNISHEMGHVLNLWHTHHGTVTEGDSTDPGYDANQCKELVNGSNSSSCGDYVEDTPADPGLSSSNVENCIYTGTERDTNNQAYNPDVTLIMSYTPTSCKSRFSSKQGERMRESIENLPYLMHTQHRVLSGPSILCSSTQSTYSINNLPSDYHVNWSIDNSNFSISPSNNQCFVTYTGTPQFDIANLTATISWSGTTINTLTKQIMMQGASLNVTGWQYEGDITPNGIFPNRQFTIPANKGSMTIPDRFSMDDIFENESLPIEFIEDNTRGLVLPPIDLCGYGVTEINGGNEVYLNSTRFNGMNISFSGSHSPTYYNHNGNYVIFEMPYLSFDYPVTLHATSDAQCHDFCLTFNVVPLPGTPSGDEEIWVNLDGSMLYVTFFGTGGEPIGNGQYYLPNYSVTITKILGGTQVYSNNFPGTQSSFSVNTSSWTSGIYSIRIVQGNNIYTKSIYL